MSARKRTRWNVEVRDESGGTWRGIGEAKTLETAILAANEAAMGREPELFDARVFGIGRGGAGVVWKFRAEIPLSEAELGRVVGWDQGEYARTGRPVL